jgi:hypothetical protein
MGTTGRVRVHRTQVQARVGGMGERGRCSQHRKQQLQVSEEENGERNAFGMQKIKIFLNP